MARELGFTERRGFCCHGTGALAGGHRKDMNFGYWRRSGSNLTGARAYDLVVYYVVLVGFCYGCDISTTKQSCLFRASFDCRTFEKGSSP